MPKIIVTALRSLTIDDREGEAWHGEARQRWAEAEAAAPETPVMAYQAPALPDWSARAPAHVTRELLGRFLQDRDTRAVHDVSAAKPECLVDGVRNGTFFHFWSEVLADSSVADDLRNSGRCLFEPAAHRAMVAAGTAVWSGGQTDLAEGVADRESTDPRRRPLRIEG